MARYFRVCHAAGSHLALLLTDLVDGEQVEVLDDKVEDQPITQLLQVGQGHRLQDGLHLRPADRLSAL